VLTNARWLLLAGKLAKETTSVFTNLAGKSTIYSRAVVHRLSFVQNMMYPTFDDVAML
jgi:hypothetical protein